MTIKDRVAARRRDVQGLIRDLERVGGLPSRGGGGGAAPGNLSQRLDRLEADQKRLRTAFEAPDPLLDPELMF